LSKSKRVRVTMSSEPPVVAPSTDGPTAPHAGAAASAAVAANNIPLPAHPPGLRARSLFDGSAGSVAMPIPDEYSDRIEFDQASDVYRYYADRRKRWPFSTDAAGAQLLCRMFSANKAVFEYCTTQMLNTGQLRAMEAEGEAIYAKKPNLGSNAVTWSQEEYAHPGFQKAYVTLKSIQRYTETYALLQRAYNAGVFAAYIDADHAYTAARDAAAAAGAPAPAAPRPVVVASLGGGPGYELLAFSDFFGTLCPSLRVDAVSLDLELSWAGLCHRLGLGFARWDMYGSESVRSCVDAALGDLASLRGDADALSHAVAGVGAADDAKHRHVDFYVLSYVFYHYMTDERTAAAIFDLITPPTVVPVSLASAAPVATAGGSASSAAAGAAPASPLGAPPVLPTPRPSSHHPFLPPSDGSVPPAALFISERSEDQSIFAPLEARYHGRARLVRLLTQEYGRDDRQIAILPETRQPLFRPRAATANETDALDSVAVEPAGPAWWSWGLGYIRPDHEAILGATTSAGAAAAAAAAAEAAGLTAAAAEPVMDMTYPNVPYVDHRQHGNRHGHGFGGGGGAQGVRRSGGGGQGGQYAGGRGRGSTGEYARDGYYGRESAFGGGSGSASAGPGAGTGGRGHGHGGHTGHGGGGGGQWQRARDRSYGSGHGHGHTERGHGDREQHHHQQSRRHDDHRGGRDYGDRGSDRGRDYGGDRGRDYKARGHDEQGRGQDRERTQEHRDDRDRGSSDRDGGRDRSERDNEVRGRERGHRDRERDWDRDRRGDAGAGREAANDREAARDW
jgi:hypothetical protein